ncbi:MAG TPA: HD domain-containing phosphohydrolase [Vicinamibacterales bacterium]|nr:HD domain-containing phosphohydrolase [Vicinamibacterales bacterium]
MSAFSARNQGLLWGVIAGGTLFVLLLLIPASSNQQWMRYLAMATLALVTAIALRAFYDSMRARNGAGQRSIELADLHLATLEALALAIDAKDQTDQGHIRRVQLYATAVAQALGMSPGEVLGVRTAALLHDIGKLAIPEHILSRPGPLTEEEFQKIRVHPEVGAKILSSVPFPHPVAELILSHHERWDGKGYPYGLKGDEIPLGARILSVVDHFDVFTSDRPYHKAMTRDAAIALLQQEAGKALDAKCVEKFLSLLDSLTREAQRLEPASLPLVHDIAGAHREIYALYELAQTMGTSLGVSDSMALIASKLTSVVPFSSCVLFLYEPKSETLRCGFVSGVDAQAFPPMVIRSGEGLVGWVARNRQPLVNARPSSDFEAAGLSPRSTTLHSAIVVPLVANDRFVAALALYHVQPDFYTDEHRRLLDRVTEQASAVIYNAVIFEQTQEDSLTDALTGLPNTRFMVMHLERELARAERLKSHVALLVIDLDNFKDINDNYGHQIGDRALREVGAALRAAIRPYDICVRYAGDEFIVVLSDCGPDEAEYKRLELQRAVDHLVFEPRLSQRAPMAASVGAAIYPSDGDTYEELLATGDSRMYRDKTLRKLELPPQPVAPVEHATASVNPRDDRPVSNAADGTEVNLRG